MSEHVPSVGGLKVRLWDKLGMLRSPGLDWIVAVVLFRNDGWGGVSLIVSVWELVGEAGFLEVTTSFPLLLLLLMICECVVLSDKLGVFVGSSKWFVLMWTLMIQIWFGSRI